MYLQRSCPYFSLITCKILGDNKLYNYFKRVSLLYLILDDSDVYFYLDILTLVCAVFAPVVNFTLEIYFNNTFNFKTKKNFYESKFFDR